MCEVHPNLQRDQLPCVSRLLEVTGLLGVTGDYWKITGDY